ncbi:hypothetical protein E2C01_039051 [Portunus trituberculatus]|uniref:Uncharacterized protein n=1 Tax=Portunus trituberculatus TaxID=210409 RepID=A0A5B7FJN9_PORTR|nr:hypothetical protein [Portunus trituberculatus]
MFGSLTILLSTATAMTDQVLKPHQHPPPPAQVTSHKDQHLSISQGGAGQVWVLTFQFGYT